MSITPKRFFRAGWNWIFHRQELQAAIKEIHATSEGVNIIFQDERLKGLATILADAFVESGASNLIEFDAFDPATRRRFRITVQPADRPRPSAMIEVMKIALRDIAKADDGQAGRMAMSCLKALHYDVEEQTNGRP